MRSLRNVDGGGWLKLWAQIASNSALLIAGRSAIWADIELCMERSRGRLFSGAHTVTLWSGRESSGFGVSTDSKNFRESCLFLGAQSDSSAPLVPETVRSLVSRGVFEDYAAGAFRVRPGALHA